METVATTIDLRGEAVLVVPFSYLPGCLAGASLLLCRGNPVIWLTHRVMEPLVESI